MTKILTDVNNRKKISVAIQKEEKKNKKEREAEKIQTADYFEFCNFAPMMNSIINT